jgi:hypothetical protein
MACSFAALARSECPPASAAPAAAAAAAAFEWSPAGRAAAPLFASLSAAPGGARRAAGAPLFALARAAAAPGVEDLRRVTVTGDGRCLFRAIALGLARNQGRILRADSETLEADQLRLAVADVLCRGHKPRQAYGAAVLALEAEDTLKNYCEFSCFLELPVEAENSQPTNQPTNQPITDRQLPK